MSKSTQGLPLWTIFTFAAGFRLATLYLARTRRSEVRRSLVWIAGAGAAIGLLVLLGRITPARPLEGVITAAVGGAVAIIGTALSRTLTRLISRAPPDGEPEAEQASQATDTLRDLLTQFQRDYGGWADSLNEPAPAPGIGQAEHLPMQTVGVDPYRVLGVGRTADDQAVRGRYLALVERDRPANYPDSADFTPQRTRAAATVSILNEAYRLIRNERGWS